MMLRCIYHLVAFAILLQSALAATPRAALLVNGQSLYRNGQPFAPSTSLGPWSIVPYEDDGANYSAGPQAPASDGRDWLEAGTLPTMSIVVNDVATPLVFDPSITKTGIYRAKQTELQVESYPSAFFCRLRYRVLSTDQIKTLALRIANVAGRAEQFNLTANGSWDGRLTARIGTDTLCVYVLDAREKYPRGYSLRNGSLDLFLHVNTLPKNVSVEGVPNLEAYLTGTLSTALVPEYVGYLTSDPNIKGAATEIPASEQASHQSDTYVSIDFWLGNEPVTPRAPLVLLDGYTSPIWSKPKPGIDNPGLAQVEKRILQLAKSKLATSPRGSILYGDFSEQPLPQYIRVRGNDHYFWTTLAWRSFFRTGNPEWYELARVFQNYARDSAWRDGWQDHAKGLLPWSGSLSNNGHAVNSESLALAALTGDYLSRMEYERWLAGFTAPTTNDRESQVACRMARVAYWWTGQAKWNDIANTIEARITAEVARVKATTAYKTYGVGMPTGVNWHPLAFNVPLELAGDMPEGILSARQLSKHQQLDRTASVLMYGIAPKEGSEIGFGPLGESYVGLQLDCPGGLYDFYRARKLTSKHRLIYATDTNNMVRVWIDKTDDKPSQITVRLYGRTAGDYHPQQVFLTTPSGQRTELTAGIKFPTYVDSGQGWVLDPQYKGSIDGWPCANKSFAFSGLAGRYLLDVYGYKPKVLGPLSNYAEWQDTTGAFQYPGQDAKGNWPAGSVLVGSP